MSAIICIDSPRYVSYNRTTLRKLATVLATFYTFGAIGYLYYGSIQILVEIDKIFESIPADRFEALFDTESNFMVIAYWLCVWFVVLVNVLLSFLIIIIAILLIKPSMLRVGANQDELDFVEEERRLNRQHEENRKNAIKNALKEIV